MLLKTFGWSLASTTSALVIALALVLALTLGVLCVRSLTAYFVPKGTLSDSVFFEQPAHWAIGAFALMFPVIIRHEIPEVVTDLIGVGFIAPLFVWSLRHNRVKADHETDSVQVG